MSPKTHVPNSSHRYFKLVIFHDPASWIFDEFQSGRVRFGWGGPGMDLRVICNKPLESCSPEERMTWRYAQFLLNRLKPGDRLVLQLEQPMRQFLIGEVMESGYDFTAPPMPDFNHVINCKPLTESYIPIDAQCVTFSLRHDLVKRGQYYEIYPALSIAQLDRIVTEKLWLKPEAMAIRSSLHEGQDTEAAIRLQTIKEIAQRWTSKNFEIFCELLCKNIPSVEIKSRKDTGQGWDLTLRILDPITGLTLHDDVPVQCKNYYGVVDSNQPIDDLTRCIEHSSSSIAYLFILGELSPDFEKRLEERRDMLQQKRNREIRFVVVDQSLIADLYHSYGIDPTPSG